MYVNESNTLQLIALLKKHNIKKIVASPGNTNISFIGSIQDDPFFQIYSCVVSVDGETAQKVVVK